MEKQQLLTHAKDIEKIKEWLSKQLHLPSNIDNQMLLRFLHASNYSLEQTKSLIDLYYTIRSQTPEIFANRDPADDIVKSMFDVIDFVPLLKVTDKNYKLFIYRFANHDPEAYHFVNSLKVFFMLTDTRMICEKDLPDGEVPIFDMNGYSLKHLTRITLPVLKKYMVYTQEAHPIKLKQIHILNTPPFLDRCLALVRPFMNKEVASMLHFHQPNSETLFDYIPKDLLPVEYGGNVGSIADMKKHWLQKMLDNRDYFTDESRWKVDESKRPIGNENGKQLFGMQGSFRALSID